ncbi:hypothetical protein, partial [Yersinia pestis]|uniref:hypothetical protein n=1 Tax=Yersinia pestis TaxID=632 RepID=UPI001ED9876D
ITFSDHDPPAVVPHSSGRAGLRCPLIFLYANRAQTGVVLLSSVTFVTLPIHESRLGEAAESSVQLCSRR